MISLEVENKADSKWNERLIESGLGTIYQTMEIAKHFEKQNLKSYFLKFIDNKGATHTNSIFNRHIKIYVFKVNRPTLDVPEDPAFLVTYLQNKKGRFLPHHLAAGE